MGTANAERSVKLLELQGICTRFGTTVVHENLSLDIHRNEVLGIVGGSGSGKSVLLRVMIMLQAPAEGSLRLFGEDALEADGRAQARLRQRFAVMFQKGALFGSYTLLENVAFPLREFASLAPETIDALARLKLSMVGLAPETFERYPAQISGGMIKRVALARALAMDPELVFLDEPSAGLDPVSTAALDELILLLKNELGVTVVMVSHDRDSLWRATDRVAFIGEKRILAVDTMQGLSKHPHPEIAAYFATPSGPTSSPR